MYTCGPGKPIQKQYFSYARSQLSMHRVPRKRKAVGLSSETGIRAALPKVRCWDPCKSLQGQGLGLRRVSHSDCHTVGTQWSFKMYPVGRGGGLLKGWRGPWTLPQVSLKGRRALFWPQTHTFVLHVKSGSTCLCSKQGSLSLQGDLRRELRASPTLQRAPLTLKEHSQPILLFRHMKELLYLAAISLKPFV